MPLLVGAGFRSSNLISSREVLFVSFCLLLQVRSDRLGCHQLVSLYNKQINGSVSFHGARNLCSSHLQDPEIGSWLIVYQSQRITNGWPLTASVRSLHPLDSNSPSNLRSFETVLNTSGLNIAVSSSRQASEMTSFVCPSTDD